MSICNKNQIDETKIGTHLIAGFAIGILGGAQIRTGAELINKYLLLKGK